MMKKQVYFNYKAMHSELIRKFQNGITITQREWELLNAQRQFALELNPELFKKRKKAQSSRTAARKQIKKGSAARKIRKSRRMAPQARIYQWVAHGDASDYLCARYIDSIWSSAYSMPEPGDAFSMNDSHINCQCEMVYLGMADENGNLIKSDGRNEENVFP